MKTIETVAKVDNNGILTAQVPPEIPPGEHKVVLVIEEDSGLSNTAIPKSPLKFMTIELSGWPPDSTYRRKYLYGEEGRYQYSE